MEKEASLKKNYFYNFVSQILTLAIPIITTPYLARVLHEEGNGQYSFSFSIITYFILFANLGFNAYGQREISKCRNDLYRRSKVFREIVFARLITSIISITILYISLFTIGFGEQYFILILVLSIQVFAVVFDVNFYYQGMENFRAIAIRTILLKLMGLTCVFIFVRTQEDTWIYALCLSVSTIVSIIVMWPSILKNIESVSMDEIEIIKHLKAVILIFLPSLAATVYSVLDKTMIGFLANNPDYANGCYEQAYKINSLVLVLITIISPIFASRNAFEYSNGNHDNLRNNLYIASRYVWMFGIPLIFGFFVLSKNLCSWFLGDGYIEVPLLLMIMSFRFIFSGFSEIFGNQLFIATGRERYTTIATTIAAIINLCLNFILIPQLGAIGASITTLVAEFIVVFVLAIYAGKSKSISLKKIMVMSKNYIIAGVCMYLIISLVHSLFTNGIISFFIITMIGGCIYFGILLILKDEFIKTIIGELGRLIKDRICKED